MISTWFMSTRILCRKWQCFLLSPGECIHHCENIWAFCHLLGLQKAYWKPKAVSVTCKTQVLHTSSTLPWDSRSGDFFNNLHDATLVQTRAGTMFNDFRFLIFSISQWFLQYGCYYSCLCTLLEITESLGWGEVRR